MTSISVPPLPAVPDVGIFPSSHIGDVLYSSEQVTVAETMWTFWNTVAWGTRFTIAAIANADRETSLNPTAIGDDKGAFNIGQWHWSPRGADILAETGLDVRDGLLATGLQAMYHELSSSMRAVQTNILACQTNEDAAQVFCLFYESPGSTGASSRSRLLATAWAEYFGVRDPT